MLLANHVAYVLHQQKFAHDLLGGQPVFAEVDLMQELQLRIKNLTQLQGPTVL